MDPFMGEIRIFSMNWAPQGWAMCNGQFLPINQNQALFSLLGTNYGGNGQTNFALPDLRSRVPIHLGSGHSLGEAGGQAAHTLTTSEMPTHVHTLMATSAQGNALNPRFNNVGHLLAADPGNSYTTSTNGLAAFAAGSVGNVGGSQPHENRQPFLILTFCIALQGLFPTQN
ncbi:MAG TPA: tail fiber protein [Thermoanaerobaculia bacterium]|nr:tail fiber protein [Thermoanaerobaculia bacterium]